MDHVGVVVDDLAAAVAFFVELGLQVEGDGPAPVEGQWVDRVVGIDQVRVEIVFVRTPDGHGRLELTKFHQPAAVAAGATAPNTFDLRRVMFAVDDIDEVIARMPAFGAGLVGEVAQCGAASHDGCIGSGSAGRTTAVSLLPSPPSIADGADRAEVVAWVASQLGDLAREGPDGIEPGGFPGGQSAADTALANLDVTGYARNRSTVLPPERRGASRMSPYIRHGLLPLPAVWAAVEDAPSFDRQRYRDELLWQEYARHLYARVGRAHGQALRYEQPRTGSPARAEPWPQRMNCMAAVVGELHRDGWLVNQTRMWLASQWAVRSGADWRAGEDEMFTHLLDGSRAANRLGWQWTVGTGSGKPYGFSRWQVEKRAPELCRRCPLNQACPIQEWPEAEVGPRVDGPPLGKGPTPGGPQQPEAAGTAEQVWLTAESLGVDDPALASDPHRPAVFVFDEPLLRRLRLSGKRLVFLAETLGELAQLRTLEVRRGSVSQELTGRSLATTYAPVPGWARIAHRLRPAEIHPWPWLVRPGTASIQSFSAWRRDHHR